MKTLNERPVPLWIPFIGWVDLPAEDALELDLPIRSRWRVFVIEWFGFGITLLAEPRD